MHFFQDASWQYISGKMLTRILQEMYFSSNRVLTEQLLEVSVSQGVRLEEITCRLYGHKRA